MITVLTSETGKYSNQSKTSMYSNPEVAGSNPVPATNSEGPVSPETGPFRAPGTYAAGPQPPAPSGRGIRASTETPKRLAARETS